MTTADKRTVPGQRPTACPATPPGVGELAERRLRGNPDLALQDLSCDFRNGVLTLRGRVPTYYLRQAARAAVERLEQVTQIDNQLEVVVPAHWSWTRRV